MRQLTIGKLGGISRDGKTVVFDADSDAVVQIAIPAFPVGTRIKKNRVGNWVLNHASIDRYTDKQWNRLKNAEEFYYQTKDFLPYCSYQRVLKLFPENASQKFIENPWFLTRIHFENGSPITTFTQIDSHVVLNTFARRVTEMSYAMFYILDRIENEGHTWVPYHEFEKRVKNLLENCGHPLNIGNVGAYLKYHSNLFYYQDGKVAKRSTYETEYDIYRAVNMASCMPSIFPRFIHQNDEDLSVEQNNAIHELICDGGHFSILTGGPGTGKTTILKTLVDELTTQYSGCKIHLLSPTGKAARRIKEVFGAREISIQTVHKFLGYGHHLTQAERNIIKSAQLIIIDESSMLDLEIFHKLISMVNLQNTKIILVGDVDQLPSIGAGNILSDLIELGVHTKKLNANFRSHGSIIDNAHKINRGEIFLTQDDSFKIRETVPFLQNLSASMLYNADVIITPYRVSMNQGKERIGSSEVINPIVQERHLGRKIYGIGVGDNIIMTKTNYAAGYCNGETGVVLSRLPNGDTYISFGDREITVKNEEDIALAYAITVHKSQGSEYEEAVISIPPFESFYTRRMLYTAVTRAKRKVRIEGRMEDIRKVIANNQDTKRRTFLSSFPKIDIMR